MREAEGTEAKLPARDSFPDVSALRISGCRVCVCGNVPIGLLITLERVGTAAHREGGGAKNVQQVQQLTLAALTFFRCCKFVTAKQINPIITNIRIIRTLLFSVSVLVTGLSPFFAELEPVTVALF